MVMIDEIVIKMMTREFILWRCLHGGPLTPETIDQWITDTKIPLERYRARNKALLERLTDIYGACAVLARHWDKIVGLVRFYPRVLWNMDGAGHLCLQQDHPAGPQEAFVEHDFPRREDLLDQTLKVHCLMTGSPGQEENPYQRKGIATRMIQKLIEWAKENGWKQVEADSFEDLPIIYQVTGSAGHTFWEKLGFRMVDRFPHPYMHEFKDFVAMVEEQAKCAGIDPEKAKDSIIMRLDLE